MNLKSAVSALVTRLDRQGTGALLDLLLTLCDREPDYCLCMGRVLAVLTSRSDAPLTVELSQLSERYIISQGLI